MSRRDDPYAPPASPLPATGDRWSIANPLQRMAVVFASALLVEAMFVLAFLVPPDPGYFVRWERLLTFALSAAAITAVACGWLPIRRAGVAVLVSAPALLGVGTLVLVALGDLLGK